APSAKQPLFGPADGSQEARPMSDHPVRHVLPRRLALGVTVLCGTAACGGPSFEASTLTDSGGQDAATLDAGADGSPTPIKVCNSCDQPDGGAVGGDGGVTRDASALDGASADATVVDGGASADATAIDGGAARDATVVDGAPADATVADGAMAGD